MRSSSRRGWESAARLSSNHNSPAAAYTTRWTQHSRTLAKATAHRAHPCAPGHLTGAAVNSTVPTFLCFEMLVASSSRQDPGWFSQNWKTGAVSVSSSQWFG